MESPHMYESANECNKRTNFNNGQLSLIALRNTNGPLNAIEDYSDIGLETNGEEISVDLSSFNIDHSFNEENLSQDLQSLNVDKNLGPRGLGAMPVNLDPYANPLAYIPQPVHHGSQFDRYERIPIKEEPSERSPEHNTHEYLTSKYNLANNYSNSSTNSMSYQNMGTPNTVSADLLNQSMKSPSGMMRNKGIIIEGTKVKSSDEYRRRRERNNIAVRKSREKAKERSRQTEEKVKSLTRDNDKLLRKCESLSKEVASLRQLFNSLNHQYLPEPVQRELQRQLEILKHHHIAPPM